MTSYICIEWFEKEDDNHKGYSLEEYDLYNHIPPKKLNQYNERNHRLTLWKNLNTTEYELIKVFVEEKSASFSGGVMITNVSTEEDIEVWKKSKNLSELLKHATIQYNKFYNHNIEFKECTHKEPECTISCNYTLEK